jgi:hypothetical protein
MWTVVLVASFALAAGGANPAWAQTTWYVDDDAPGDLGPGDPAVSDPSEDGTADHPFDAIQEAIDAATNGDVVVVLQGNYAGEGGTPAERNRDLDFGGKDITVRSEDPDDPAVVAATVIDCEGSLGDEHRGFIFQNGETSAAVVSGLTITGGYEQDGGGIYCNGSSPTVSKCVISANGCARYGGGIYCYGVGSPAITMCVISDNDCLTWGGGICCFQDSTPAITDCEVVGNTSLQDGGGVACYEGSHAEISNCLIAGNTAGDRGGAVFCNEDSDLAIRNTTIQGNSSARGAAVWSDYVCNPTVVNCTVAVNAASSQHGGIYAYNPLTVTNCVLWGNTDPSADESSQIYAHQGGTVTYTCIQNCTDFCTEPTTNIGDDPLFVDADGADNDPAAWEDNDLHLLPDSPCIDTGDPAGDYTGQTDMDGQARVIGPVVDRGADEVGYFTLDLAVTGDAGGDVVAVPEETAYGYRERRTVQLTPVPSSDLMMFDYWAGDVDEPDIRNNPLYVIMDDDKSITAVFKCACGDGVETAVPLLMAVMVLMVVARRRR